MPTAPSVTRSVSFESLLAEITDQSTHTANVPTLLELGRAMEGMGVTAAPRFTRDDNGFITGLVVGPASLATCTDCGDSGAVLPCESCEEPMCVACHANDDDHQCIDCRQKPRCHNCGERPIEPELNAPYCSLACKAADELDALVVWQEGDAPATEAGL